MGMTWYVNGICQDWRRCNWDTNDASISGAPRLGEAGGL